jgi:hypothetical protein
MPKLLNLSGYKKMRLKILSVTLNFAIIVVASFAFASDYPKSRDERIQDEMGSLAGEGGISFSPFHSKKTETKSSASNANVNKFLWHASRSVLKFMPSASIDISSGTIVTDWYSTSSKPNYGFKIEVIISGDTISPDSIGVNVYERNLKNGHWYNLPSNVTMARKFEDKIVRKARELYIENKDKK